MYHSVFALFFLNKVPINSMVNSPKRSGKGGGGATVILGYRCMARTLLPNPLRILRFAGFFFFKSLIPTILRKNR